MKKCAKVEPSGVCGLPATTAWTASWTDKIIHRCSQHPPSNDNWYQTPWDYEHDKKPFEPTRGRRPLP